MELNSANIAILLAVLLGVSEALSLIPAVKSNGIFQLAFNILKALCPKKA